MQPERRPASSRLILPDRRVITREPRILSVPRPRIYSLPPIALPTRRAMAARSRFSGGVAGNASDEPIYQAGSGTLIYHDDFTTYGSTLTSWGATPGGFTNRIVPFKAPNGISSGAVDPTENALGGANSGWNGVGRYARVIYDGHVQNGPGLYCWFPTTVATEGAQVTYQSWYERVTPSSSFTGALAVKHFLRRHNIDVPSGARIEFDLHDHLAGGGTNPSTHNTYFHFFDAGTETATQAQQPVGPWFNTDIADGTWRRITWVYKCSSGVGARDGYAKMYVSGTKVMHVEQSTVNVTPPGGENAWCQQDDVDAIRVNNGVGNEGFFGSDQTSYTTPSWWLDISDVTIWTI